MTLDDLLVILDELAPFSEAEDWDNVGLIAGDPKQEINRILLSLDPCFEAIRHSMENSFDLIISHHPLLIEPVKKFNFKDPLSRKLGMLFKAGISLVSMHTNLDRADGGVADTFAQTLKLANIEKHGFIRTGYVEPASLSSWVKSLPFKSAMISDAGSPVRFVAACPGSGMGSWQEALKLGCDTIVTGDVKYSAAVVAKEFGLNTVDLGHFATESIVLVPLAKRLETLLEGLEIGVFTGKDVFISI